VLTAVYGHFRPKTFRHYVFDAEVSHIFALVPKCPLALVPKCLGQFGTKVHETLRTQNWKVTDQSLYLR